MNARVQLFNLVAILLIGTAIIAAAGGELIKRDILADGTHRTQILTIYKKLPLAPIGPSFCDVLNYQAYALALPCDFRPPFVDLLEGKRG